MILRVVGTLDAVWETHLRRLYDCWSSVLRRSGRYHGNPFSSHRALLGLDPAMFHRWQALFSAACYEALGVEAARTVEARAANIACSLTTGLFGQPTAGGPTAP